MTRTTNKILAATATAIADHALKNRIVGNDIAEVVGLSGQLT